MKKSIALARPLEIVGLNISSGDTTSCEEMRKPFDVLDEGPSV